MTERDKFFARFNVLVEGGLVDMKFFPSPDRAVTEEQIFQSANHLQDLIDAGKTNRVESFDETFTQRDVEEIVPGAAA